MSGSALDVRPSLREEVEDFLFAEAELLDSWQLEPWLALFTPDCRYWVPANADHQDPVHETSLAYDDHDALEDRVLRLLSPTAYSQNPRSRTRRIISNLRLVSESVRELRAISNFLVYEVRLDRERVFGGRYEHVLQRADAGWHIKMKKVALVNNDTPIVNLTILL